MDRASDAGGGRRGKWGRIGEQKGATRLAKGRAVLPQVLRTYESGITWSTVLVSPPLPVCWTGGTCSSRRCIPGCGNGASGFVTCAVRVMR